VHRRVTRVLGLRLVWETEGGAKLGAALL